MAKKEPKKKKPQVHEKLDGLDIKVNSLGEVISSYNIDDINKFLDDNVEDKKLADKKPTDRKSEEE